MRRSTPVPTWARSCSTHSAGDAVHGVLDGGLAPAPRCPTRSGATAACRPRSPRGSARRRWRAGWSRAGARGRAPASRANAFTFSQPAAEALGRVEVGEPAVSDRARPPEDGVDIAPDQHRRPRPLGGPGDHHRVAQVELVGAQGDALLGPEAEQDVEVPLELPAALLERHPDRVELARVPAGGDPEDQPPARDHVEAAQGLGRDHRVAQRQHQHAGAELDPLGAGRHRARAW